MAHETPWKIAAVEVDGYGDREPSLEKRFGRVQAGEKHLESRHGEITIVCATGGIVHGDSVEVYLHQKVMQPKYVWLILVR